LVDDKQLDTINGVKKIKTPQNMWQFLFLKNLQVLHINLNRSFGESLMFIFKETEEKIKHGMYKITFFT
jgi:hypothetical protein